MSPLFPWFVTNHAVEKYIERVDPTTNVNSARDAIERLLPEAMLLPVRTRAGHECWSLPGINAVVVARPDPKDKIHVVVTTLGPNERIDSEEEVVAAYSRSMASKIRADPEVVYRYKPSANLVNPVKPKKGREEKYLELCRNYQSLQAAFVELRHYPKGRDVPPEARIEIHGLRDKVASVELSEAKARAAEKTEREQCTKVKLALRHCLVALESSGHIDALNVALASIEAIDPGLGSEQFMHPERFTPKERKDAGRQLRAVARGHIRIGDQSIDLPAGEEPKDAEEILGAIAKTNRKTLNCIAVDDNERRGQ